MPITNNEVWEKTVKANTDGYGGTCIKVAREAMRLLDTEEFLSPLDKDSVHKLITLADKSSGAGGITGFMAGCVAAIISKCHSRGEEFIKAWNDQYRKYMRDPEDDSGVVNPALWSA